LVYPINTNKEKRQKIKKEIFLKKKKLKKYKANFEGKQQMSRSNGLIG